MVLLANHQTVLLLLCSIGCFIMITSMPVEATIDCFKCASLNGSNPTCEDPFHNNYSRSILETPCMGGRKGRDGLFPATACIKLQGVFVDNKETIMVRGCALDSGTLTTDTEIIRMSHCGHFYFEDRYVKGCLQSCSDYDACNTSTSIKPPLFIAYFIIILLTTISTTLCTHLSSTRS